MCMQLPTIDLIRLNIQIHFNVKRQNFVRILYFFLLFIFRMHAVCAGAQLSHALLFYIYSHSFGWFVGIAGNAHTTQKCVMRHIHRLVDGVHTSWILLWLRRQLSLPYTYGIIFEHDISVEKIDEQNRKKTTFTHLPQRLLCVCVSFECILCIGYMCYRLVIARIEHKIDSRKHRVAVVPFICGCSNRICIQIHIHRM